MTSIQDLQFAVKYSFTQHARSCLESLDIALESIPLPVHHQASNRIQLAYQRKPYTLQSTSYREVLEHALLSYPLAKVYLSVLEDPLLNEKFAESISKTVFENLEKEPKRERMAMDLLRDQSIELEHEESEFVISLIDYLKAENHHSQLHLVHQRVQSGKVYITLNTLLRWISEYAYTIILQSIPTKAPVLSKTMKLQVEQLKRTLAEIKFQPDWEDIQYTGSLDLHLFPDCMRTLYSQLYAGENLPHSSRFALATFLTALHVPIESILQLFARSPNFNDKTTRYHLNYIAKKGYPAPSCKKLRELGLACPTCRVKLPIQYYRNQLKSQKNVQEKNPAPEPSWDSVKIKK